MGVGPRAHSTTLLQALKDQAPWLDRRGRLHPLRAVTFTLLLLPGLWLAFRWGAHMLGAEPVHALELGTGYWAVWLLMVSLMVSPAKALLGIPNLVVVRRMIGVAVAVYAGIHLLFYMAEQNWRLLTVATEIAVRFYLTIGFVALLGLGVLTWTSSDTWVKRLGKDWKRLHRYVFGLAALAAAHFFLQSKADVSAATLAAGVFAWLMLWRLLPAGRDRGALPLLGLAVASAAVTLGIEYAWYRFGTHIDPQRVLRGEFDLTFGVHPAGLVLVLGLAAAAALEVRNLGQGRLGQGPAFTVLLYAAGALVFPTVCLVMGWPLDDVVPDGVLPDGVSAAWLLAAEGVLFGLLGVGRYWLRGTWQSRAVDAFWAAAALFPFLLSGVDQHGIVVACGVAAVTGAALLTWRTWPVSRAAALLVLPLAAGVAMEAASVLLA